jgi:hypothetical protein
MNPITIKGNRITPEQVDASIIDEHYIKAGKKTTVCHLTLADGFEVIGVAGTVDPANFDANIGNNIAKNKALDKVYQHLGSILQNKLATEFVEDNK